MTKAPSVWLFRWAMLLAGSLCLSGPLHARFSFPPVDPTDLALKEPSLEKDAGAEVLLWKVAYEDFRRPFAGSSSTANALFARRTDFVRIKIFSRSGAEAVEEHLWTHWNSFGRSSRKAEALAGIRGYLLVNGKKPEGIVLLPAPPGTDQSLAARVIRPDGGVQEVDVKGPTEGLADSGQRQILLPRLEPGCILEYYLEVEELGRIQERKLILSPWNIPVRLLTLRITPLERVPLSTLAYHAKPPELTKAKSNVYEGRVENIPSRRHEPFSPPGLFSSAGVLLYYDYFAGLADEGDLWMRVGKGAWKTQEEAREHTPGAGKTVVGAVGPGTSPEATARSLFSHVRGRSATEEVVAGEPREGEGNRREKTVRGAPSAASRNGQLTFDFVAFARAAGLDARLAMIADKEEAAFSKAHRQPTELSVTVAAVRLQDRTLILDPGSLNVPFGMLRWQLEGQPVLLADPKDEVWVTAPSAETTRSSERRVAELVLSANGSVEGEVRITYSGHRAIEKRDSWRDGFSGHREERVAAELRRSHSDAKVSAITFVAMEDPEQDLVLSYRVHVPGYGQRTGKALTFSPSFFESGPSAIFTQKSRRNPIVFPYGWTSSDRISIKLPDGFVVKDTGNREPLQVGPLGAFAMTVEPTTDGKALEVTRSYSFSRAFIPQTSYEQIKRAFDLIHEGDKVAVTLEER